MTVSTRVSNRGRLVFGVAALVFGLITLAWPDYYEWLPLRSIWNARDARIFAYAASAAQILGGAALEFRRTAKAGAIALGAVYLAIAFLCVPRIVATPRIYDTWGNFFEQFSLATGAAIVYARMSATGAPARLQRIGSILFGICTASFAVEQGLYLHATAPLVPKWLPPSQMFWAVSTTVLFALAALALLTNRMALLASRLLTMMIVLFGLLVWIPLLFSDPHKHANWSETAETFAIAGTAWILTDLLGAYSLRKHRPR